MLAEAPNGNLETEGQMNVPLFINKTLKTIKSNSSEILTALGISGVVTTSYLTSRAAFAAADVIRKHEELYGTEEDPKERLKERTKLVWRLYIPAGVSGAATIGCIIGATRSNTSRTTAAVTAYTVSERAFNEYREKVAEQIGKGKEQKIRDEIAQDAVDKNPLSREVVIAGAGEITCYELFTGRYLKSDMETLRKAENRVNAIMLSGTYVTLDEFYDLIGLDHTSMSDKVGWTTDKLMALEFSSVLGRNGEPCLAFDYNYIKPL